MKLASLNNGRDGRLVIVSRDLTRYLSAASVASTLQQALDNWQSQAGKLENLYEQLNTDQSLGHPSLKVTQYTILTVNRLQPDIPARQ